MDKKGKMINDNPVIKQEVDLLLNAGFRPTTIVSYLSEIRGVSVSRRTIHSYINNHYKPEEMVNMIKVSAVKNCGKWVDAISLKVALIEIFKARIQKALENEEKTPFTLRAVDESMMRINTVLNELFAMYQEIGLVPKLEDRLITESSGVPTNKSNQIEELTKGMTNIEKSRLANKIGGLLIEATDRVEGVKEVENNDNKGH